MARNDPQVNLRFPAFLKAALDRAAEENKRSLTAEIVARLEATFAIDSAQATVLAEESSVRSEMAELRRSIQRLEGILEKAKTGSGHD